MERATTADKIFLPLFLVFALLRLYEFLFQGQSLADALGAVGFAMMAFGTWNRAFAPLTRENLPQRRKYAQIGTFGGMVLVLASLLSRWIA